MNKLKTVICMKWGTIYSSDYVNVLYNACKNNITGDFTFVCLTNDPQGIDNNIVIFPIPEIGLAEWQYYSGAWPKLGVFKSDLYGLTGRALFIDLDSMIWGNIDRLFDHTASIVGIDTSENWRPNAINSKFDPLLGTGVFAFTIGEQSQILEKFQNDSNHIVNNCKLEQVWVQIAANGLEYWPINWVISFKRWLRRPIGLDLFLEPKSPPNEISILAFHGTPRPIELIDSKFGFWDRFPHLGRGNVGWAKKYWIEHGGSLR